MRTHVANKVTKTSTEVPMHFSVRELGSADVTEASWGTKNMNELPNKAISKRDVNFLPRSVVTIVSVIIVALCQRLFRLIFLKLPKSNPNLRLIKPT